MKQNQKKKTIDFLQEKRYDFSLNTSLAPYLSLKIGGRADIIVKISNQKEFICLLDHLNFNSFNFTVLGGGTNTVFSSPSFDGLVIVNNTSNIQISGDNLLFLDSGIRNSELISFAQKNSLGGFEFIAGIPGTIGGALVGNAGSFNQSIQDIVESAQLYNKSGEIITINKSQFNFQYRNSDYKMSKEIFLSLTLRFNKSSCYKIKKLVKHNLTYRRLNHPSYKDSTAGCFFKNPLINHKRVSAGQLIEKAGFKGKRFGPLKISNKHANFLINNNNADYLQLKALEEKIIREVKEKFNLTLKREIIYISEQGDKF